MVWICVWQLCQTHRIALEFCQVRGALLAIDKDFLDDYSKLEKTVQAAVKAAIDKFRAHTQAGLHLEKINHC